MIMKMLRRWAENWKDHRSLNAQSWSEIIHQRNQYNVVNLRGYQNMRREGTVRLR